MAVSVNGTKKNFKTFQKSGKSFLKKRKVKKKSGIPPKSGRLTSLIRTEEDSIHQLDRAAQVTIFRLRTGHCQLLSHLHRLKISHSDECPCGTGPQTPNHILQSCPTFDDLRRQTWSNPVEAHRKLWGPVETLRQTADFTLLTGLKI